jgi:cyclophilin family peptidyl-prolyl cis-trans isomerase
MRRGMPRVPLAIMMVLLVLFAGCMQTPDDEEENHVRVEPDEALLSFYEGLAADRHVVFETDHGEIRLHLFESLMPVTTARFIELVEEGFYDGTVVHRNVERFVIQGGDPTGTGAGGSLQSIPHERHEDLLFGHGALGLARNVDEDSGDSQWFISLTPQPHLSDPGSDTAAVFGLYSLYGQVVEGMDAVRSMNGVMTIPGLDRPVDPPVIERATIVEGEGPWDLLGLPRTISDRTTINGMGVDVDRPLHVFQDHPFELGVFLRPGDSDSPPVQLQVRYEGNFTTAVGETMVAEHLVELEPVAGDPWSFTGTAVLPRAGTWSMDVRLGNQWGAADTVEVQPWSPEYERFGGGS